MKGSLCIVSGRFKGRNLATRAGEGTRPLLTRIRKSLADILRPQLPGAHVLDLFGGTGAIGFELLSNGAETATFIELNPEAASVLRSNCELLGVGALVLEGDALEKIPELAAAKRTYDVVMVAPPYNLGLQQLAIDRLASHNGLVAPEGIVIVQRDRKEAATVCETGTFSVDEVRTYGRTVFEFFSRSDAA